MRDPMITFIAGVVTGLLVALILVVIGLAVRGS
jgi:hypothetical protein